MATGNHANSKRVFHSFQGNWFSFAAGYSCGHLFLLITPLLQLLQHFTIAFTKAVGSIPFQIVPS
jgi:hypothetical protein